MEAGARVGLGVRPIMMYTLSAQKVAPAVRVPCSASLPLGRQTLPYHPQLAALVQTLV